MAESISEIPKVTPESQLSLKETIGYAFGDFGGCMTFAIMGSFLLPYYTEVAGMSAVAVSTMFLLIKVWDAINDPLMGAIMDKAFARSSHKQGKFRPWMLRSAPVVAISAILMFAIPNGLSPVMKVVWAYGTYLLYEASYTAFNIPYGSLLSAMANNETDRAKLSSARGMGGAIGNVLPMMIFPIIIDNNTGNLGFGYILAIGICAIIGLAVSIFSYKMTKERVAVKQVSADSIKATDILEVIKKNRAFVGISLAAAAAMLQQTIGGTLGIYYFRDNLNSLSMMGLSTMLMLPVNFLALALIPSVVKRIGNERTALSAIVIGIVISAIPFFFVDNLWLYIITRAVGTTFISIPIFLQWGMIAEAIDYNEYLTGKRTEGSIYGTFNLFRRFGQAIGASFGAALIGIIGYSTSATVQAVSTLSGIRFWTLIAPIFGGIVAFIAIKWIWNIDDELRAKISAHKEATSQE